jgi:hypothetical protein
MLASTVQFSSYGRYLAPIGACPVVRVVRPWSEIRRAGLMEADPKVTSIARSLRTQQRAKPPSRCRRVPFRRTGCTDDDVELTAN